MTDIALSKQVPEDGHRLGPFAGLRICTSGHSAADKAALGTLIESAGGTYCKNLTKACTHLVLKHSDADGAMSDKERCGHLHLHRYAAAVEDLVSQV